MIDHITPTDIQNQIKKFKKGGSVPSDVLADYNEFKESLSSAEKQEDKDVFDKAIKNILSKYPNIEQIEQADIDDGSIKYLHSGNWYKEYPSKILGTLKASKDMRGNEITYVVGDVSVLDGIDVSTDFAQFEKDIIVGISDIKPTVRESLITNVNQQFVEGIIEKSNTHIGKKAVTKKVKREEKNNDDVSAPTLNISTFKEIYSQLNKDITLEDLRAYIWYKDQIGQRLSDDWYLLAYGNENQDERSNEEKINDWVKNGVLFYFNGSLYPKPIYASGNVYEKITRIIKSGDNSGQDIEYITTTYSQDVLEGHLRTLNESFQQVYKQRLVITGNDDSNSLILKPISKFAKEFMISEINSMEEFKWWKSGKKDSVGKIDIHKIDGREYHKEKFESLSLTDAYCLWLTVNRNKLDIKGNITYNDIIYFYIEKRTKQAPSGLSDAELERFKAQIERTKAKSMSEGNRLFLVFLSEELSLNQKVAVETKWNASFNNYLKPDFNKIPVAFNVTKSFFGEEPFTIKPEKREAVSFIFNEGSGCLAYDVGVGKTISAIMAIEQFLVAGYCKRPFVIVPNQTYKQWLNEIKNLMPHRKINALFNLSPDYMEEVLDENNNVRMLDEGSISVLTYEGFARIGFNEATKAALLTELYDILNQGGADELMSEKKKASFYEKLEMIVGKGLKGTNVEIEQLGFDFVCYDEAHALKKVFTSVKGEQEDGKKGRKNYSLQSGTPSDTALKGFMISQYILKNNNYRNILLLTATPFTNSPLEVFSMLSLVAYHHLDKLGLKNINDFFDNYIDVNTELVINHKLQPQYKQIVKGFSNLPSLQRIILRFFNYKDGDDIGIIRPNKIVIPFNKKLVNGEVVKLSEEEKIDCNIEMSNLQKTYMSEVIAYAEGKGELGSSLLSDDENEGGEDEIKDSEAKTLSEDSLEGDEKAGVRALKAMNFARNIALSPYLYEHRSTGEPDYKSYINTSPKLKYVMECIRSVKKYHESKGEPMSGQVIYMDRGLKYFSLIRDYLIYEIGFEKHEVGEITARLTAEKKSKAQDAFLGRKFNEKTREFEEITDEQRMKVLLGSSSIKEGISLQKKSTVLYNCFIDWNPTDMVQLQGRIWRQQNQFMNVRIVNPLMIDSMDIFMFQKLEEKTARLNTIWSSDGKSVLKIEEVDTEEIKFALIKDPRVIAKLESEQKTTKLTDDASSLKSINERLNNYLGAVKQIAYKEEDINKILSDFTPSKLSLDIYGKVAFLINFYKQEYPKDDNGRLILGFYDRKYNMEEISKKFKGVEISPLEKPSSPYWFSSVVEAKRLIDKENRDLLQPRNIKPEGIIEFVEKAELKIKDIEQEKKFLTSEDFVEKRSQQIVEDRERNKYRIKNIEELVSEFGKLNYLLSILRPKEPKAEKNTNYDSCQLLDEKGKPKIDEDSIRKLTDCVEALPQTKDSNLNEVGEYTDERRLLHIEIIDEFKEKVKCIKSEQPIAILTGGSPASGKSSFLNHYAPYFKGEELVKIDADEIRAKLPEYRGWNATSTHAETRDIINTLLTDKELGMPCNFDLIYDGTMNSVRNYLPLIGTLKRLGYKIFIVYMDNVPYSTVKNRMLERYQKTGRFVPISVIDDFFSKGKSALDELKTKVDGYMVIDASNRDYNIIEKGGIELPLERNYSTIATPNRVANIRKKLIEAAKKLIKNV